MASVQRQDLFIFNDQSVLSRDLYTGDSHDMILISSTNASQPLWLIIALVETRLLGNPVSINSSSTNSNNNKVNNLASALTIGSFIHSESHYTNALHKLKVPSNGYKILDFVLDFVMKNHGKPREKILSGLVDLFPDDVSSTIILDQPEMLLSLIDGLTSDELHSKFINPLMRKSGLLIISTSIELYQNEIDTYSNTVNEFNRFTMLCHYKSLAILALNPLDTGHAKDVSGKLRISRGGVSMDDRSTHVIENEYSYLTEKESTKLFYR